MWNKKKVNPKVINKIMDNKVEIERQVRERNINKFIKRTREKFEFSNYDK